MEEDPYVMLDPPSATCLSNKGVFCRLKASDGFGYFLIDVGFPVLHSGPENFKKTRQKNSWNQINQNIFSWNCIFGVFPQFKIWFLAIFEIAKNGIWSTKFFVKLIYLISRVFLAEESEKRNQKFSVNNRIHSYLKHDDQIDRTVDWKQEEKNEDSDVLRCCSGFCVDLLRDLSEELSFDFVMTRYEVE